MKLVSAQHFAHTPSMQTRLLATRKDVRELGILNFDLGERLAEAALDMLALADEEDIKIDFISSPGHTVAHFPPRGPESPLGALQIGESAVIAERTNLPVISGFHSRDLAAGGQGALLRPYADWILFRRDDHTTACLHLGGLARVTIVTPNFDDVLAFDIGPCNMVIDGAMRILSHGAQTGDKAGVVASKGVVVDEFLDFLLDHSYLRRVPPKSTSRIDFGPDVYLRDALSGRREHALEDLVATVTSAVAYSVTRAFTRFISPQHPVSRIVVTGQGVRNKTLMQSIRNGLPDTKIRPSDRYEIPFDAMDAISAAILGNEMVCGRPANVPSATGARRPVILGKYTPA
jgi:anhydro-N-acetylmuramic acid kinase